MKKIYKYTLLLIAAFLFAPLAATADDENPQDPHNDIDGLGFTKNVAPDPTRGDNAYNITLTAFTTGSTLSESLDVSVAADIVLVLDVSGSMVYGAGDNVTSLELNKLYEFTNGNQKRYGMVFKQGNYYYLRYNTASNGVTFSTTPTGYSGTGSGTGWPGYNEVSTMPGVPTGWTAKKSRITLLQEAVKSFVSTVYSKNPSTGDKHKIAIVKFAGGGATNSSDYSMTNDNTNYNGTKTIQALTEVTSATQFDNIIDGLKAAGATNAGLGMSNAYTILNNAGEDGHSKVTVFFTDGEPGSSSFHASTARTAVTNAYNIKQLTTELKQNGEVVLDENNKPIILESKVYSVGLLTSETSSNTNDVRRFMHYVSSNYKFQPANNYNFQSNATNSRKLINTGTESEPVWEYSTNSSDTGGDEAFDSYPKERRYYQLTTDGKDLESIFQSIASSSSNAPTISVPMSSTSVVAVDVISNNFKLPDNANTDDIIVKVAKFKEIAASTGINPRTGKQYTANELSRNENYVFEDPITITEAKNDKDYVKGKPEYETNDQGQLTTKPQRDNDGNIIYASGNVYDPLVQIVPNTNNKEIKVTKFNYADNWCGYDQHTDNTGTHNIPHGYEIVIIIPIEVAPQNPGGANVDSNGPGSGITIYNDDNTVWKSTEFPRPLVVLPNIIIRKYGLEYEDEAASFKLEKLNDDGTVDNSVPAYNLVVVHKEDPARNFDFVQVKLQHKGRYRVTETDWGWSYTCTVGEVVEVDEEDKADMSDYTVNPDKMKELEGVAAATVAQNGQNGSQPYIAREVSAETEQTILVGAGKTLAGAVFDFHNRLDETEKRNYSESHKLNEFKVIRQLKPATTQP